MPLKVTCVHPGVVNTPIARSGTRNAASLQRETPARSATSCCACHPRRPPYHHLTSHVPRPSPRARGRRRLSCLPPELAQPDGLATSRCTRFRSHVSVKLGDWFDRPHLNRRLSRVTCRRDQPAERFTIVRSLDSAVGLVTESSKGPCLYGCRPSRKAPYPADRWGDPCAAQASNSRP